jgi:hypothetical protein
VYEGRGSGTHILADVKDNAVMFTDIQSPGMTRRLLMEKAAAGNHSHHADEVCSPFELICPWH